MGRTPKLQWKEKYQLNNSEKKFLVNTCFVSFKTEKEAPN